MLDHRDPAVEPLAQLLGLIHGAFDFGVDRRTIEK